MKELLWFSLLFLSRPIMYAKTVARADSQSYRRTLHHSQQLIDLHTLQHPAILETKQINISQFPGAFNPCIIRFNNSILLSFRVRDKEMISTFGIGMQWLDNNFEPVGQPYMLHMKPSKRALFLHGQDPRLIIYDNQLYIVYNNFTKVEGCLTRRMVVAQVSFDGHTFITDNAVQLHSFEEICTKPEKNWVPFVYNNNLLLAYSLTPHRIVQPNYSTGDCPTLYVTASDIQWNWGELRGGTPALRDKDRYIAFFHSSRPCATVQSNGKRIMHYVMGAYTFQADPPFAITHISQYPLIGPHFYDGPMYNTWKPLRVVFPMGYIMDEKYIWISYGKQDFEMWIAKIDKELLLNSLVPIRDNKISV